MSDIACFLSRGSLKINFFFEKDKYIQGKPAILNLCIDNRNSKNTIKNLKCQLVHILKFKIVNPQNKDTKNEKILRSDVWHKSYNLVKKKSYQKFKTKINLKTRKGKPLPSTTNGKMIQSSYELILTGTAKSFFSK